MRRHRQDLRPMTEMNVTNLLDTAFILLMAFMIVAPSIKHGIELNLPEISDPTNLDIQKSLTIVIRPNENLELDDEIYIDGERVDFISLRQNLEARYERSPELSIIIDGDESSSLGTSIKVLAIATGTGFPNVGFSTLPITDEDKEL